MDDSHDEDHSGAGDSHCQEDNYCDDMIIISMMKLSTINYHHNYHYHLLLLSFPAVDLNGDDQHVPHLCQAKVDHR